MLSKGEHRTQLEARPPRILLLEDEPMFALLVENYLGNAPGGRPDLETAQTLGAALARLNDGSFDLVISDLHVPDSSGLDTLARLAQATDRLIIVLTGSDEPALRESAIRMGAYDFVRKQDLKPADLTRLVRLAVMQANTYHSLRESQMRMRSLLNLASDWYWEQDEQMRFVRFEGRVEEMAGAPASASLGKRRWEIPGLTPLSSTWAEHRKVLEARLPFRDFEYARRVEGGTTRYTSVSGKPVLDAGGRFLGYRGVATDITARRRAEDELRRFRLAMDNSGDLIVLIDRATMRYIDVNRATCDAIGYPREEILARGPHDILDLERAELERAYDALIAEPSSASQTRSHYRRKDGSLLPLESVRRAMRSGDDWIIVSVGRDITQRLSAENALRASEARKRAILDASVDSVVTIDHDGRVVEMNAAGERQFGYPRDAAIGRDMAELMIPPELRERHRAGLARLAAGGSSAFLGRRVEVPGMRADGSCFDAELSIVAIPHTSPALFTATVRDVTERRREELRREEAESALRRFRTAVDGSADMLFLIDAGTSTFIDFNAAACRELGYTGEELFGMHTDNVRVDRELGLLLEDYRRMAGNAGAKDTGFATYRRKDGSTFPVETVRRVIETPDGPVVIGNARNLTERMRAAERQSRLLRYQAETARFARAALGKRAASDLIEAALHSVSSTLAGRGAAYLEAGAGQSLPKARAFSGMSAESVGRLIEEADAAIFGNEPVSRQGAAFAPVQGESGCAGALSVVSTDAALDEEEISFLSAAAGVLSAGLQRISTEDRLAFLAQFDPLTGLPNRSLLDDRFSQMLAHASRSSRSLGVLFVDLDQFMAVNDSVGHRAGDELLKEAARRLQQTVRPGDTVSRVSGDEFAVVLDDLARTEDAALVAQKILDALSLPFRVGGQQLFVTASIGIAASPADGNSTEALLGAAAAAMYRAKRSGRNSFQFHTAEINKHMRSRLQLGTDLRRALERGEFSLAYQPKYDLQRRRAVGAEALLRWSHAERGSVSPAEFVPVLEEIGLISAVGEWALEMVCADLKQWEAAGLPARPVAVNLSARQFHQQDLHARIETIVRRAAVNPALIELEITESQLMADPEQAIRTMQMLTDSGLRIAIDDFGTGYSSLSYLTRFPVTSLKIDRSFVADALNNAANAAIVRAVIDMAKTLNFTVVAEGVETEAQAAFLRGLGCGLAQGWLFAKPMPAQRYAELIAAEVLR